MNELFGGSVGSASDCAVLFAGQRSLLSRSGTARYLGVSFMTEPGLSRLVQ